MAAISHLGAADTAPPPRRAALPRYPAGFNSRLSAPRVEARVQAASGRLVSRESRAPRYISSAQRDRNRAREVAMKREAGEAQTPATTPPAGQLPAVRREPAIATGALALVAAALGAVAVGALAVGAAAIGRLAIGQIRLRRGEIDELRVGRLTVGELRVEAPQMPEQANGEECRRGA
jgi:hypothetical protein